MRRWGVGGNYGVFLVSMCHWFPSSSFQNEHRSWLGPERAAYELVEVWRITTDALYPVSVEMVL